MSPVGLEHEENYETCHHCHLTAPIPLAELIKTHPLRSVVAKKQGEGGEGDDVASKKGTKSEQDDDGPIRSFLDEVASKKFLLKKTGEVASTSGKEKTPPSSLDRKDKSVKLIKPVHSFLHHVSGASVYKISENPISETAFDTPSTSNSLENSIPKNSSSSALTPDVIINAKKLNYQNNPLPNYSTIERKPLKKATNLTDSETQTSRRSSVSKPYFIRSRYSVSDFSSFIPIQRRSRKRWNKFFCTLPSGLLFAGYGLLIVIGIVVGVALTQRERSFSAQSSAFPRRPNFAGATRERIAIRAPSPRTRISNAGRRRVGSVNRVVPGNNVIPVPAAAPILAPTHATPPAQVFADEDFDYFEEIGLNDPDLSLANQPRPLPRPQAAQPVQAFRPVEIEPQFRPQAQAPAQEVRTFAQSPQRQQQSSSPRRGTSNTFKQEFNLQPQEDENAARGHREPEVKIIKSWSNRNADGTFSWGYMNTDGSFKNETKGVDCVVRGVYGYIDETTGEKVSFPYVSGNPCDPDAPDYYFDYDQGTEGGQTVQRPRKVVGVNARNRS